MGSPVHKRENVELIPQDRGVGHDAHLGAIAGGQPLGAQGRIWLVAVPVKGTAGRTCSRAKCSRIRWPSRLSIRAKGSRAKSRIEAPWRERSLMPRTSSGE